MTGELPLRRRTMLMLAAAAARTVACRRVTTSRVDGNGVLAPRQDRLWTTGRRRAISPGPAGCCGHAA